jgi:ribonuclease BN (tRNA processing enzyme)
LIDRDITFVIDVGFGTLERLESIGAFNECSELHIHISHRHTDHLIGIFPLLQCLAWSDDYRHLRIRKVVIHSTKEVRELIEGVRALWGVEETQFSRDGGTQMARTFEFASGPDYEDWAYKVGDIEMRAVHLPSSNNHGVSFSLAGKRFGFTADATEFNDSLINFVRDTDVCVIDFGHLSNVAQSDGTFAIVLDSVVELLRRANPRSVLAAHIYLRHFQNRIVSPEERLAEADRLIAETAELARQNGFTGRLTVAKDFMDLLHCAPAP